MPNHPSASRDPKKRDHPASFVPALNRPGSSQRDVGSGRRGTAALPWLVGLSCRSAHFSRRGATNSSTHPGVSVTFLDVSGWAKNVSVCLTDVSVTVTFVSVSGIFVSVSLPDVFVRPTFVSVTDVDVSVRGVDVCSRLLDDVYGAHGYVHEQDANRFHPGWRRRGIFDVVHAGNSTVTRVPPPGVDSTALRPASSLARAARFFKPRPFPFRCRC